MIGSVRIQNFKSIRELQFEAKKVNLFIGEPNTGKSNVIEALAFLSPASFVWSASEILRFENTAELFFDQKVTVEIQIEANPWGVNLVFGPGHYQGHFFSLPNPQSRVPRGSFTMNDKGINGHSATPQTSIRFYIFKPLTSFPNRQPGVLNPPFGDNLVTVLYTDENLRQKAAEIVRAKGFRLMLKPTEGELLIAKEIKDELYSYPWYSVSETLRRVVFYIAVLDTNRDAVLLLDEPETNTFPPYTKHLAERIGLDESNQFFITTHNPYLLSSIVEKTPAKDLNVFVTVMEKFETKLKRVPEAKLPDLLELDSAAFFNLDRLVEE